GWDAPTDELTRSSERYWTLTLVSHWGGEKLQTSSHSQVRQAWRMTFDVLVVGSANADLVVPADRRPAAGETVLGGDTEIARGGRGGCADDAEPLPGREGQRANPRRARRAAGQRARGGVATRCGRGSGQTPGSWTEFGSDHPGCARCLGDHLVRPDRNRLPKGQ